MTQFTWRGEFTAHQQLNCEVSSAATINHICMSSHSRFLCGLTDNDLEGKCVSGVRVAVNIQYPCTSQLQIKLWGPRRRGIIGFEHDTMNHSMSAILFSQHNGREDSQCGENITSTWFDDGASLPVRGCCNKSPFTGVFRPYESLGKFNGSPASGNWTLDVRKLYQYIILPHQSLGSDTFHYFILLSQVFIPSSGDYEGELIDWTLSFSTQPCRLMDEGVMQWERVEVTGDDIPFPRVWHTAIALEESIFVIGGVGGPGIETPLKQNTFRLDIKTSTWVKLTGDDSYHSTLSLLPQGMNLIISPWGLIGLRGRRNPLNGGSDTWLLNFVSLQWDKVHTNTSEDLNNTWEAGPVGLQR